MSYPRWVNAKGEIEIGGEDYFAILAEAAEAERKAVDDGKPSRIADTGHIATISDRAHKRMESLAAVPPERLHEAFAKQERMKRGGIDETTTEFVNFVDIVGHKTGCNAAAGVVIGAIKRLLELLGTCNRGDFNKLDTACNAAEDALSVFSLALAAKQDAEVQPPVKAVLVGEQSRQLANASTKSSEAMADLANIQSDTTAAAINAADAKNAAVWTKQELERKKRNAQKTGRKNQHTGEKNGNGRKTDTRLRNQIMTEVQQTMKKNKCTQSNACQIVANKHLKADGKTPIFSKRTIENWMSTANAKKTKNP